MSFFFSNLKNFLSHSVQRDFLVICPEIDVQNHSEDIFSILRSVPTTANVPAVEHVQGILEIGRQVQMDGLALYFRRELSEAP